MLRRSRKSMLLKLAAFLLLGAIVNVAVAWGLGLRSIERSKWTNIEAVYPPAVWHCRWWQEHGDSHHPEIPRTAYEWSTLGRHDLRMDQSGGGEPISLPYFYLYGLRAGLPFLCLEGARWTIDDGRSSTSDAQRLLFTSGGLAGDGRGLPLRPLWPGFAINTIFYAAILWLLWIAPGKIRRFVRIRGHRCPACGFIIAADTCANGLCSECGHVLPWRQRTI